MTDRLYYRDAYTTSFEAEVTQVTPTEDGHTRVLLDRTFFYPTGGGQLQDRGTLGGLPVADVLDEDERVVHVVEGTPALASGDRVQGEIDTVRRAHHRQQHTGQHVLSRVAEDLLDLPTVSSRLGETYNTLDLPAPDLSSEQLTELEDRSNRILWEARPVHVRFVSPSEAAKEDLLKDPDRTTDVRVIDVEGFDRCPCGGTHVHNTAEIGLVAITRKERLKGMVRLQFLCGQRAVEYRRRRDRLVSSLSARFTTGEDQLEGHLQSLWEELKTVRRETTALRRELLLARLDEWLDAAEPFDGEHGQGRLVAQRLPADVSDAVGSVAARLAKRPDVLAALVLDDPGRNQLLLARGAEVQVDCAALLREVLAPVAGKGGGRPDSARGSFPGDDQEQLLATIRGVLAVTD